MQSPPSDDNGRVLRLGDDRLGDNGFGGWRLRFFNLRDLGDFVELRVERIVERHRRDRVDAEARAIVIHNAWYAEPDMIPLHGKLGRSEGCFAMSRASQDQVMRRLAGGRMIFADKLA